MYNISNVSNWHLPWALAYLPLQGLSAFAAATTDLQYPLKRVWGEGQKMRCSVLRGQQAGQVFRSLGIFRSLFHEANSCISSYLEKH